MEIDVRLRFTVSTSTNTPDTKLAGAIAQLPVRAAVAQDRISGHYSVSKLVVSRATSLASSVAAVPALVTELQHIHVINA